ncbi:MAG TPA: hypothetical protein ENN22_16715 [bacterium]|nr:hypothetical protein [bacterium]
MRPGSLSYFSTLLLLTWLNMLFSQTATWRGQFSGWLSGSPEKTLISKAGFRYVPDVSIKKALNSHLFADAEISLNTQVAGKFKSWENQQFEGKFKPYRLWARLAGNQFEVRIGLQKINFGSAILFRPLMWFDRIDPRDPLKLTDGVYGLLLRYYFHNNANIWLWGLYDNNDLKGWEIAPTEDKGLEFGGRLQLPIFVGEIGFSYHHRRADFSRLPAQVALSNTNLVDENRFAFDAKVDIEIGLWVEASIMQRETNIPFMKYQRMWTIGADYTFGMGNGLTALAEFFSRENSTEIFGAGDRIQLIGSSLNYPIGLLDQLSGIYYYDWTNRDNYLLLNWQRTYDNWLFYLIAFFNPETVHPNQTQTGGNEFSGNGFQLMLVFNH